jgi:hypothetical protein
MTLGMHAMHAANGPHLITGAIALVTATLCLGLLIFLLSPARSQDEGIVRRSGDVMAVRRDNIRPPELRGA